MFDPIEYVAEHEPWSRYILPDDSVLRVKVVVTRVQPFDPPRYDPTTGVEILNIQCQQIIDFMPSKAAIDAGTERMRQKA